MLRAEFGIFADNIIIEDHPQLQDAPNVHWDSELIA